MLDRQLRRLADGLPDDPRRATLRPTADGGELGTRLAELADRVAEAASGAFAVEPGGADGPELEIVAPGRGRVRYLAMPEELEAEPFVDHLLALLRGEDDGGRFEGVTEPVELEVFVSEACPHCAQAVRAALELSRTSPLVQTTVIDATRFPELADRYRVRSVPATVIDGGEGLTGATTAADLAGRIRARGTPEREADVFASLVEAGRFEDATARVLASGPGAFAATWMRGTLSLRLGLLVAADGILEADPRALDGAVEAVLPALDDPDPGPRGDTADLLGKIGHSGALGALRAHADDAHPDVREAVADALESIEEGGVG